VSRWWLVALLPVVWVPVIALTLITLPQLPLWSIPVALVVWLAIGKRRRDAAAAGRIPLDTAGDVSWSPTRGGGY
jgi:hypothetical protein